VVGIVVECRAPHRSQQDCLRFETCLDRGRGQRVAELGQCGAADFFFVQFQVMAKTASHFLQNTNGLCGDFRTDPVAGQGSNAQLHGPLESDRRAWIRYAK